MVDIIQENIKHKNINKYQTQFGTIFIKNTTFNLWLMYYYN